MNIGKHSQENPEVSQYSVSSHQYASGIRKLSVIIDINIIEFVVEIYKNEKCHDR